MRSAFGWTLLAVTGALLCTAPVAADQAACQKQVLKQLLKLEKVFVKSWAKCSDLENLEKIPGPCLDSTGQAKLDTVSMRVADKIGSNCTSGDLAALGFSTACGDYGSAASAAGAACAALPAASVDELVACVKCWKAAELSSYVAVLYASHALEICDGSVADDSSVCQPLACATPLPDQRILGASGSDSICQKGIGKGGFKYFLLRAKTLANCALQGGSQATCLADATVQERLAKAEAKKTAVIKNKCGNRDPEPSPAFCCRTTGNMCVAAATREDCTTGGGEVQEGKFCDLDSTCTSLAGNKQFPWWGSCPDSPSCPGTALGTTDDLIGCVDSVADRLVDRLLCLQLHGNGGADWPCPASPSGAFLE